MVTQSLRCKASKYSGYENSQEYVDSNWTEYQHVLTVTTIQQDSNGQNLKRSVWAINLKKAVGDTEKFALYLGFYQEQWAHPDFSEGRLNSNLLRSAWLPGVEPGTECSCSSSCGVRINLAQGSINVCSIPRIKLEGGVSIKASPGCESKSLILGYPFAFLRDGVHSNKHYIKYIFTN